MMVEYTDPALPSDQAALQARSSGLADSAAESVDGSAFGILWDAVQGHGADRTHTGEMVLDDRGRISVAGYIRPFRIPRPMDGPPRPCHSALGLLLEAGLADDPGTDNVTADFDPRQYQELRRNTLADDEGPPTTSVLRFLEGLAAILGLEEALDEGLGAAEVLARTADQTENGAYLAHPTQAKDRSWILDWEPLVRAALSDLVGGTPVSRIAARVDNGLVEGLTRITGVMNVETVVLAGHCFRNRHLRFRAVRALRRQGHRVLLSDGAVKPRRARSRRLQSVN
ncbi:MAG: hypothetical protein P8188_00645 [Gemmatimonadota bacterium]